MEKWFIRYKHGTDKRTYLWGYVGWLGKMGQGF
jgi:hypothetical protein